MSRLTTDPNDPDLGKGVDTEPSGMNRAYLVQAPTGQLQRPIRRTYRHVGVRPVHPTRPLTDEEEERYAGLDYLLFEVYPESLYPALGKFWKKQELESGCGTDTTMGYELALTYAQTPSFYGATFCVHCQMHLPVKEFVWVDDGTRVGS